MCFGCTRPAIVGCREAWIRGVKGILAKVIPKTSRRRLWADRWTNHLQMDVGYAAEGDSGGVVADIRKLIMGRNGIRFWTGWITNDWREVIPHHTYKKTVRALQKAVLEGLMELWKERCKLIDGRLISNEEKNERQDLLEKIGNIRSKLYPGREEDDLPHRWTTNRMRKWIKNMTALINRKSSSGPQARKKARKVTLSTVERVNRNAKARRLRRRTQLPR